MADQTDFGLLAVTNARTHGRGSAYTQLMWAVMQGCFESRCEVLAVNQTPDESRSVDLLPAADMLPVLFSF